MTLLHVPYSTYSYLSLCTLRFNLHSYLPQLLIYVIIAYFYIKNNLFSIFACQKQKKFDIIVLTIFSQGGSL